MELENSMVISADKYMKEQEEKNKILESYAETVENFDTKQPLFKFRQLVSEMSNYEIENFDTNELTREILDNFFEV